MARDKKYPPVITAPTVDDCMKNFRMSDYMQWAGATLGSWGFGFMVGRPARFGMAGLMAGIGFTFGSLVAVQNTRGRLMGFRENGREIAKLGAAEGAGAPEDFRPDLKWNN